MRTLVRAFAWVRGDSPAGVLTATDAASTGLGPGIFATAVVATLGEPDDDDGVPVRISNAGHLPPVVLAPDGVVRTVGTGVVDLPLGVGPGRARHDETFVLAPGSVLVMFTDGLVERRDRDLAVGLADVDAVLGSLAGEPLDVLLDSLLGTLLSGVGQADDVAAVAVRVGVDAPRPADPATSTDDLTHHLPFGPTASAVARFHVARFGAGLPVDVLDDARLLVSELAGNAVRHGAAPIDVRLRRTGDAVDVGVRDAGAALLARTVSRPVADRTSGRGLLIVDGLADDWWVEPAPGGHGKTVWFRLGADPVRP